MAGVLNMFWDMNNLNKAMDHLLRNERYTQ